MANAATTTIETLLAHARGRCVALTGPNFSGRSRLLQSLVNGHDSHNGRPSAYVGPEIYTSISSLALTVRDELELHLTGSPHREAISQLLDEWRIAPHLDQNPFSLSGGEQAALVLLCKLALNPVALAIDCAFEQLDPDKKAATLAVLESGEFGGTGTLLADNRFSEATLCREVRSVSGFPLPQIKDKLPLEPLSFAPLHTHAPHNPGPLKLSGVTFRYKNTAAPALRSLECELQPGHIYHLRGKNGAGKSTLARLLCGVLPCRTGRIQFCNRDINPWKNPGQLVAYHFQNPDMQLFATTVQEELNAGIRPAKEPVPQDILQSSGFAQVLQRHPMDLPFVSRKRLALLSVLTRGTPWMVIDEPTIGQDDSACSAIARMLAIKAERGTGIILITHSEGLPKSLPATTLMLQNGTLTM
jgi:energy-coupling factor transporter ATP-binding protein EcfA2